MRPPEVGTAETLERFYRFHAPIYDFSRPFILFGRERLMGLLDPRRDQLVLDVGCGTGFHFQALAGTGARVVGIESSPDMRERAERKAARLEGVRVEEGPYGPGLGEPRGADRILFSYSLSMMPGFAAVLGRAREDLRPGGRIGVVDFLRGNVPIVDSWLRKNHVHLGPERLRLLQALFPSHDLRICWAGAWEYYLFVGDRDGGEGASPV
jgi:S-adenosylmethionine-diacylgycerolhomoserine-N-methlytransferase